MEGDCTDFLIKCIRRRVLLSFISSALICTPVLFCYCAWEQYSTGSASQFNTALNRHFFARCRESQDVCSCVSSALDSSLASKSLQCNSELKHTQPLWPFSVCMHPYSVHRPVSACLHVFFSPLVCLHLRRTFKGTFVHVTPSRAPIPRRDEDFPSAAICVPQRPRSFWSNRLFFFRRARTTQTWTNQAHLMLHLSKRLFHPARRLIKEQSLDLVLQILLLITAHISFFKKKNKTTRISIWPSGSAFCSFISVLIWVEHSNILCDLKTATETCNDRLLHIITIIISAVVAKEKNILYRLLILQFITTVTFSTETLHLFSLILNINSPSSSLCCKCQINFYDCSFFTCCHHNVWH